MRLKINNFLWTIIYLTFTNFALGMHEVSTSELNDEYLSDTALQFSFTRIDGYQILMKVGPRPILINIEGRPHRAMLDKCLTSTRIDGYTISASNKNLTHKSFRGFNIIDSEFANATLTHADFSQTKFVGNVNLSGAKVNQTIFIDAHYLLNGKWEPVTKKWLVEQGAVWDVGNDEESPFVNQD